MPTLTARRAAYDLGRMFPSRDPGVPRPTLTRRLWTLSETYDAISPGVQAAAQRLAGLLDTDPDRLPAAVVALSDEYLSLCLVDAGTMFAAARASRATRLYLERVAAHTPTKATRAYDHKNYRRTRGLLLALRIETEHRIERYSAKARLLRAAFRRADGRTVQIGGVS